MSIGLIDSANWGKGYANEATRLSHGCGRLMDKAVDNSMLLSRNITDMQPLDCCSHLGAGSQ